MIRTVLYFVLIGSLVQACAPARSTVASLSLGETQVDVVEHRSEKPGNFFYNMHDNENTGVEAAKGLIKRKGGVLFELVHTGERNIEFELDSVLYEIDPNRIYTDTGIWRELERTGVRDSTAFELVRNFSDTLIELMNLEDQLLVITLHNNTDENYSIISYIPGGDYEVDAEAVYNGNWKDHDEFYFVTTASLYGLLTPTQFNVVLQNNALVTDDGSLSVYCGQRGIDYINVEAQHGHKRANRKMIKRMLKELRKI